MKKHYLLLLSYASVLIRVAAEEEPSVVVPPPPPPPSVWARGELTGDWNGSRTRLADKGIIFDFSYITDPLGNPVGGLTQAFQYAGAVDADANIDFSKFSPLTGLSFRLSAAWSQGSNLANNIGCEFAPAGAYYYAETFMLNELYFKEALGQDNFVLKAGRLDTGGDFITSPLLENYVAYIFDANPGPIFVNFPTFGAYPFATWGAFLQLKAWHILAKFGAYNANSTIFEPRYHGANFTFDSTNGTLFVTEWAYLSGQDRTGVSEIQYPGNYRMGACYTTGASQTFLDGTVPHNWNAYILFDQMIYQPPDPTLPEVGLYAWLDCLFGPKNRNTFPFSLGAGLVYQGWIRARPYDTTSFAIAYEPYSSDLRASQEAKGEIGQTFEIVMEFNHWFQCTPWLEITPDLQLVINPSGKDIPTSLIAGLQAGIHF